MNSQQAGSRIDVFGFFEKGGMVVEGKDSKQPACLGSNPDSTTVRWNSLASVSPYELIDAECLEQGLAPRKCPTVPAISVLLFERRRAAQADMDSWDH